MKDNIKDFKEKEEKKNEEEKKVVVSVATCPNCKNNSAGVLKITVFDQLGVEGIRVCKNCGVLFMEETMLEIVLSLIEVRQGNGDNIIKLQ